MSNKNKTPNREVAEKTEKKVSPVRIIVCLTVICIAVAAMLGVVNHFTKQTIEDNEKAEKDNAIASIFGDDVKSENISGDGADNEVYLILRDGKVFGYCAEVATKGFGGEIKMMVGVDYSGAVCGVKIVSMSETPGLGSRTNSPSFLDQFNQKSGELTVGTNVDKISGATISSKAVTRGVSDALALGVDLPALAAERKTVLWGEAADETETETVTETEEATESVTPETEEPETTEKAELRLEDTVTYVDRIDGAWGPSDAEAGVLYVDVHTETDVYIVETEEPPTDWAGNYIFPEEETETEEVTDV